MAEIKVKLLIVQGKPAGKCLDFPQGDYLIGRGPECHIRPDSEWVSRQHCLVRVTKDSVVIHDLGSRNGTLVNGLLLDNAKELAGGDQVQIGPLVFEMQIEALPAKDTVNKQAGDTAEIDPKEPSEIEEEEEVGATKPYPTLPPAQD